MSTKGLSIVRDWYGEITTQTQLHPPSLDNSFLQLHPALRETCGTVRFPPDNGLSLMEEIENSNGNWFGASDASLKSGRNSRMDYIFRESGRYQQSSTSYIG